MPSDPDPLPQPEIVGLGLARAIGYVLYWAGVIILYPTTLALVSLHFGWIEVTIGSVAVYSAERTVWAAFGAGLTCTSLGIMIGSLINIRERAMGGPL